MSIKGVKVKYTDSLLGKRNAVACGIGYKEVGGVRTNELCVVVSVTEKVPEWKLAPGDIIPPVVEGIRTDVQQTGIIRASLARTDKWRPAPGGVSIGHADVTAGTLGCLVYRDGEVFILSNNHVLANSNQGQLGDPILQPGVYDGGTVDDQIATLEEFVPISFGANIPTCPIASDVASVLNWAAQLLGSRHRLQAFREGSVNLVDAAIARPLSPDLVDRRILDIGEPQGVSEGVLGLRIQKSGRTTGLTIGQITQVDVTVQVSYGGALIATFDDQLMAGEMSQGGDSGSAVLDMDARIVGLLFAGSDTTTVINRFQNVAGALNLSTRLKNPRLF